MPAHLGLCTSEGFEDHRLPTARFPDEHGGVSRQHGLVQLNDFVDLLPFNMFLQYFVADFAGVYYDLFAEVVLIIFFLLLNGPFYIFNNWIFFNLIY